MDKVRLIEEMGYDNLVVSIKSSDVLMCVKAHELNRKAVSVSAARLVSQSPERYCQAILRSSVGLGIILYQGIGDTIRVSLTGDPLEESSLQNYLKHWDFERRMKLYLVRLAVKTKY